MKKVLLWCNLTWEEADFRYGLYSTLLRMDGIIVKHIPLCKPEIFDREYRKFQPDILISIKGIPDRRQIEDMHDKCVTIQLNPDDLDIYEDRAQHWPVLFDYYYTNSMQALEKYIEAGHKNVRVCTFACDPEVVKIAKPKGEFRHDIMFAGVKVPYRESYLRNLKGLDLAVYGRGWSDDIPGLQNRSLTDYDYYSALKSCKIAIDFSVTGSGYLNVKSKTFEIVASGALLMCNRFSEMKHYFEYDKECVGFVNEKELREACEYYLKHEDERLKIAKAGHKRFLKDHTWQNRIDMIFKDIGVKI